MLEWNAANIVDTLAIAGLLLGAALYVSIRLIRTLFPALTRRNDSRPETTIVSARRERSSTKSPPGASRVAAAESMASMSGAS